MKAMVGARRFERVGSRKDHRNGTYLRRLLTSLGQTDVAVPRSREPRPLADVIGCYQSRSPELGGMMVEAYVSGVSQRKMRNVMGALMGERVGRSTMSRVAKRLDEAVRELRSTPIEGPNPYLYLDATFLDARWAKKVENVSAPVAYAVGPDGHRRLLGVCLGAEESEASCRSSWPSSSSGVCPASSSWSPTSTRARRPRWASSCPRHVFVGDIHRFRSGRDCAAHLGPTPRESSTGQVRRLGRTTERGKSHLRMMLIHGARSALRAGAMRHAPDDPLRSRLL